MAAAITSEVGSSWLLDFLIAELRARATLDYPLEIAESQAFLGEENQRDTDHRECRAGNGSHSDAVLEDDVRERKEEDRR